MKRGQEGLQADSEFDALSAYVDTLPTKPGAAAAPAVRGAAAGSALDSYLDNLDNQPAPPPKPVSAGVMRTMADMGIKAAQGAVDLGQSVVGVGSLATGGLAGKAMRAVGYDPERTNQALAEYLSPQQREAEQNVNDAKGFVDTLVAAAKNPRAVAGSVVESLPSMMGIGGVTNAVARRIALKAAAPFGGITTEAGAKAAQEAIDAATNKLTWTSGAAEGAQSAGQIADQAQGAGRDYTDYALPAIASGVATGAITRGAGAMMGNTETALFSGSKTAGVQGSLPARIAKGFISEGALQEMPQSAEEQVMTNIAMGKEDAFDGVGNQAAMGLVTGGVMGASEGAISPHQTHQPTPKEVADTVRATQTVPETGVLSAAANVGTEAKAQSIENSPHVQPAQPEAPQVDPVLEQIKSLPDGPKQEALHAYAIINRPDVPKGVRQYNSKLLDKHLALLEPGPEAAAPNTPPAELLGGQAADPLQGAMRQQQDEATSRQNLDNWMQRAQPMPLQQAQDIVTKADERGLKMEVVPHAAGEGFTVIPQAWIAPSMRGQTATALPMDTSPTGVLRADAAGNVAPETGAQRIDSTAAKQAIDLEAQRKAELGLTPDVEAAQAKLAAPATRATEPTRASPAQAPAVAPAAPIEGDILTKAGKPFATRLPAVNAAKRAGAGHDVVPVDGGFAVRKTSEWQAFPPNTQTLGIPRAEMPQVKTEHHGALVNFLNARGIAHSIEEVDPRTLKPSQAEYSPERAEAVGKAVAESDRSILVSSDGHVLDGHHQWLAAGGEGKPVKVIRLDKPATEVLPLMKEFPSAEIPAAPETSRVTPLNAKDAGQKLAALGYRVVEGDYDDSAHIEHQDGTEYLWEEKAKRFEDEEGNALPKNAAEIAQYIGNQIDGLENPQQEGEAANDRQARHPGDTQGEPHAPEQQPQQASVQPERGNGNESGKAAEAGGGDRVQRAGPGEEAKAADGGAGDQGRGVASGKIEDAGEKIGGARKDRWAERGLRASDLEGMSGGEEAQFVTKDNIWPKIDYAKAIDVGMEPKAAALLKVVRDRIGAKPRIDSPEGRRQYLQVMTAIAEKAADMKTVADVEKLAEAVRNHLGIAPGAGIYDGKETRKAIETLQAMYKGRTNPLRVTYTDRSRADALLKDGWPATKKRETAAAVGGAAVPERPHLDRLERTGEDIRAGKDVTADSFRKAFGFRGVEFGNWAAQDERQKALNHAFDALHDLANVMGVRPEAVSLNGSLGIAFGARGSGRFAAHYEPGKLVINLTKLNGAGSLAHEWGHAMDHYFGELNRADAYQGRARGASGWYAKANTANLRPEMRAAFGDVMDSLFHQYRTKAEAVRSVELQLEDAQAREKQNPADDFFKRRVASLEQHLEEMRASDDAGKYDRRKSSYFQEAVKLSGKAGESGYWARPTEMFARAFESYVFDKIHSDDRVSQYLVQGVEPDRYATGYKGNPYPAGAEREAIDKAFDKLVDTIQTEKTDKGVAMFSKRGDAPVKIPPAAIAGELAYSHNHVDYEAAKAGDTDAAIRLAQDLVTPEYADKVRTLIGDEKPVLVPVAAIEATGKNKIPAAVAHALAAQLGLTVDDEIVQSRKVGRGGMDGLDRVFTQPEFDGEVKPGQKYLLVDDTLTQGGTFAALASHIEQGGGQVIGATALTGKAYSATITPSAETLEKLRSKYGDLEQDFRAATGYGFDALTESEARYLANFRPAQAVRDRILAERQQGGAGEDAQAFLGPRSDGESLTPLEIQQAVSELTGSWLRKPDVHVLDSMDEAPGPVRNIWQRQASQGGAGTVEGFHYRGGVYLVADALESRDDVARVLFHEALGHFGLRNVFGDALNPILSQIAALRAGEVRVKAEQYGLDINVPKERLLAAEEWLAEMAQTRPDIGYVKRAIAAIRTWLRKYVPTFSRWGGMDVHTITDDEIIRNFLLPARGFVERGRAAVPTFSTGSDSAQFSMAVDPRDASTFADRARDAFHDIATTQKTFNWWNNTVGTQYQKAEQDKHFKRAFDATQNYILDVSRLANDAADRARDLLPRLEHLRDVLKDIPGIDKNATTKADVAAITKPVFQGTLSDQRAYKPEELKRVFKLTDKQVDLYKQFRGSVDKSLDDLTTSTAAKLLRNAGIVEGMIQDELEQGDHKALVGFAAKAAELDPKMKGLADQVQEISDRAERLKAEGYAPLMRFGQYAVSVRDAKTKALLEFHLFENNRDANKAARELAGKGDVEQSVMSKEDYKLLKGVSPESLELFGDILEKAGLIDTRDEVYQTYLRKAIDQRSAMKRMIERVGYPGYSADVRRVLATFVTSNARLAAKNLHYSNMLEAVENIPREKGDVRDEAVKLVKYVQEPVEEAPKIRGLLFSQFIGGSVASAIVNTTQTLTMTYPYLSQFSNPGKAAKTVLSAMKQAMGNVKGELGDDLAKAEQLGIVSPQEIHNLNAESMKTFGSHPVVQKAMFLWGSLFSLAEQYNRRVAFISAWNTAKELGNADPFHFAVKAVEETQGVYNKGNRPDWARGALGATLFTFKQFSIQYLEFLTRLPAREKALALAILMLSAGAEGMPFADDIDDVIDTIAERMGYNFNSKQQKRRFLGAMLGDGASDFLLRGVSTLPGMPIDVAGRMGMANLIPGTGMLRKDVKDHMQDVMEFAGPLGSAVQSATKGEFLPTSIKNLVKAADMFQTGQYRDSKGRKVIDTDAVDATWKAIGFQPAEVAKNTLSDRLVQQSIAMVKQTSAELADEMANARLEGDAEKYQAARDKLKQWNEDNPESPITINAAQITSRLKEMRMTRDQRIIKSAPRAMRSDARTELQ
jgi:adenine/guanine phosphoribosyltransferase-like PRPP-binding protein